MLEVVLIAVLVLLMVVPAAAHIVFKVNGKKMKRVFGISGSLYFATLIGITILTTCGVAFADTAAATQVNGLGLLSAALATGLATIGAGIAVASAASAAIGAMSEDPKIMGKTLIFVALAEGIALYGLLVTFMILGKL